MENAGQHICIGIVLHVVLCLQISSTDHQVHHAIIISQVNSIPIDYDVSLEMHTVNLKSLLRSNKALVHRIRDVSVQLLFLRLQICVWCILLFGMIDI